MSMQLLDLNMASRPFRNNTLPWALGVLAVITALAFTIWNGVTFANYRSALAQVQGQVDSMSRELADLDHRANIVQRRVQKFDVKLLDTRTLKANEVIEWKAFSWTGLFNRMENVLPWNVQLRAIRPVFGANRGRGSAQLTASGIESIPVDVEGVAQNLNAFLDFERALLADPHFGSPEPEITKKLDNRSEQFQLRFTYYPVGQGLDEPEAQEVEAEKGQPDGDDQAENETDPAETDTPEATGLLSDEAPDAEGTDAEDDKPLTGPDKLPTIQRPDRRPPPAPPKDDDGKGGSRP